MNLTTRLRILFGVLKDAWPAWLAAGVLAVTFAICWSLTVRLRDAVLYTGTVLELAGLGIVAYGLSEMRRLFNRPRLRVVIAGWFRRLLAVFRRQRIITGVGASLAGVAAVSGVGRVVASLGSDASVDQRLAALETNVKLLRDELDARVADLRRTIATLSERIDVETHAREADTQQIARRIEDVAVGGLHLEVVGLIWLLLGIFCTNIPDEVAAGLSRAATWVSVAIAVIYDAYLRLSS